MLNKIRQQLNKIHNFYLKKFKFYRTWHEQPNSKKIHKVTLALFALFALTSALYVMPFSPFRAKAATNYYVTDTGSDTNDGSAAHPWKTISYAIAHVSSGDTILCTGSFTAFNLSKDVTLKAAGAASISVAAGRAVTISAAGTLEGFELTGNITGTENYGIIRISSSNATVKNNNIHDAWGATAANSPDAIYVDSGLVGVHISDNNLSHTGKILSYGEAHISGNTISYTPWHPTLGYTSLSQDGSIQIGDGSSYPNPSGSVIEHNTITYPWGNDSKNFGSNTTYHGNDFEALKPRSDWGNDPYGQPWGDHKAAIYDENHNGTIIDGNTFRQVVGTHYEIDTDQAVDIRITNNLFIGPQGYAGSLMLKHRVSYPGSIAKIYNNTFLTRGMYLSGPIGWTAGQVKVKNNIFAGNDYAYLEGSSNVYDHQYNIYKSTTERGGATLGTGEVVANPLLDGTYHLQASSQAINTGLSNSSDSNVPLTDKDGRSRVGATDMGVYESQPNYYISPSGTSVWSGCTSINSPCSMATALSSVSAGDTVNVASGTYATRPVFSRSGTEANRIVWNFSANVVMAAGLATTGDYNTIDGNGFTTTGYGYSGSAVSIGGNHNIIHNFDLTDLHGTSTSQSDIDPGTDRAGVEVTGTYNEVYDFTVTRAGNSGMYPDGSNNYIHDFTLDSNGYKPWAKAGVCDGCTKISKDTIEAGGTYNTLEDGLVTNSWRNGMYLYGSYNTFRRIEWRNNIAPPGYENDASSRHKSCIHEAGGAHNAQYNVFDGNIFGSGTHQTGISFEYDNDNGTGVPKLTIKNSIFYTGTYSTLCILFQAESTNNPNAWLHAYNNVFYGNPIYNGAAGVFGDGMLVFKNNIFNGTVTDWSVDIPESKFTLANNLYNSATNSSIPSPDSAAKGSFRGNPGFVSATDWRLTSSSDAIDKGVLINNSTTDNNLLDAAGNPRIGTPEIGAYEYQGSGGTSCTIGNGDVNGDGHVNISDAAILMAKWNQNVTSDPADVNCSGKVDISDAAILMSRWGT